MLILRRTGASGADLIEADLIARQRDRAARTPGDPQPQLSLGGLLFDFARLDLAVEILSAALSRDPLNLATVKMLTIVLLKQGKPEAAVPLWQPAFAADPKNGRLPFLLARILAYGGFMDQARRMLDRAEPPCREIPTSSLSSPTRSTAPNLQSRRRP